MLIDSFKPETPMEQQLAQSVAEDNWRLNRIRAIETNIFALGHEGERREQTERALEKAQLLAQQSLLNGLPYDPAKDGFVFSNAEINLRLDRGNRLREAKLNNTTRKPISARAA